VSSRTDPAKWREAKHILDEALELPAQDRAGFIAAACAGSESLRRDVESLAAASESESLLDAPVPFALDDLPPTSRVGERIGAYELLEELGRGGMGVVYLARRADDEFQRRVAIKLVSAGLADRVALGRFRSERQISASLDHPHIARLLDGGATEGGEPYFVMEYVEGEPLLEYCEARGLSVAKRLAIFRDVCAAVQHAHQNLVVHRDLKPSNILVSREGEAKLLDFGIAKLLDPAGVMRAEDGTATLYRMLTPDYASPEQVRGRPVSTASDVYTLGVVLYELLAGQRPYHIATLEPEELLRLVCEEDPERLSAVAPSKDLGGDLDAIVALAMRKEPGRRYSSAAALSEDIGRHLDGLPVLARKGTTTYRAGKFLRRHRFGVAAAMLVLAALAGGLWTTLREARRARAAEARAERRFNDVRRLANSFLFEFHDAIRDLPGSTAARALVVTRALEYLDGLSRESSGDRALRRELAEAYRRVGDVQGNPFMANLGDLDGAITSYQKSIALLEPGVAGSDATDEERATLATAYLGGGGLRLSEGKPLVALAMARKGLALRVALAAHAPGDAARQMELSQAWQYVAFDANAAGRTEEGAKALAAQAAILEERFRADPSDRAVRRSLGQNLFLSAGVLHRAGDDAGALEEYRKAERLQEDLVRDDPASVTYRRDLAWLHTEIGSIRFTRSGAADALAEYLRALALFESLAAADPRSTDPVLGVAMSHHNAGLALAKLGRRREALDAFATARTAYEGIVRASPSNAWVSGILGSLYVHCADLEAETDPASACRSYRQAIATFAPIAAGVGLDPERQTDLDRARERVAACSGP
jgi:tetratricopeptide (TPR) repeat protein